MSGVGSTNAMKKGSANNPFLAFSEADMAGYLNSAYTGCIVKYSGEAIKRQISDINKTVGEYAQNLVFDTTKLGLGAIILPAAIKIDITKNGSSTTQYIYEGWVKDGKVYPSAVTGSINTLVLASSLNSGADVIAVINNGTWQREAVNDQGKITLWSYSEDVLFTVIPDANGSLAPFERFVSIVPYIVGELYKVVYGDGVYYYEEFYYISEERTTGNSDYIAPGKTMYDFTGSLQTGNGSKINPYIANTVDEMNSYLTTAYKGAFIKYVGTSTADYTKGAVYQVLDDGDTTRYAILPTLENEGTASDLAAGKQLINSQGEVVEGTAGGEIDYTQDVMFWDYDGTLVYSCTLDEAKALTELPEAPNHADKGLVFNKWNYTLDNIKALKYGADIGALYLPADNKTHLFINVASNAIMDVKLYIVKNYNNRGASIDIDWGDGESEQYKWDANITPSSENFPKHTYKSKGKYEIKLLNSSETVYGNTNNVTLGTTSYSTSSARNLFGYLLYNYGIYSMSTLLIKAYTGRYFNINCGNCPNLTEVTFNGFIAPFCLQYTSVKHVNTIGDIMYGAFKNSAIETFSMHGTSLEPSFYSQCLKRIATRAYTQTYSDNVIMDLPQLKCCLWERTSSYNVSTTFYACNKLKMTVITEYSNSGTTCLLPCITELRTTSISLYGNSTKIRGDFISAPILEKFIITGATVTPLTAAFSKISSLCKYYVPDDLVDTYKTTDGWKDMADRIYSLSEMT